MRKPKDKPQAPVDSAVSCVPAVTPLPYCNRRLREARLLAWCGSNEAGIASYFGISWATYEAWKREHPELDAAVRSGRRAHAAERQLDPTARRDAFAMLASRAARGAEAAGDPERALQQGEFSDALHAHARARL